MFQLELLCSDVKEIDAEDKEDLAAFPFDEEAELASLGAALPVGEKGFTTLERRLSSCMPNLAHVQLQEGSFVCQLACFVKCDCK